MSALIVFDIDNTLAMTEEPIMEPFYRAVYEYIGPYAQGMDFAKFMEISHANYTDYGCCVRFWAAELDKDMTWILAGYKHTAPYLFEAVTHLQPDEALRVKLETLQRRGHTLVACTHAHRDYSFKLLKMLKLDGVFPDHMVHDIELLQGNLKRTDEAYRYLLNHYADQVFLSHHMIEDTPANLVPAKRFGFTTWMVGTKPIKDEILPFLDHRKADIHEVLDALLEAA